MRPAAAEYVPEKEVVTLATDDAEEGMRPAAAEYVPEKDHLAAVKITGKRLNGAYVFT